MKITDEMVEAALDEYLSESKYASRLEHHIAAMRAALEAALSKESEYEYARMNSYGYVTEPDADYEDAKARAASYPAGYTGGFQTVVRRVKAGKWEEVDG